MKSRGQYLKIVEWSKEDGCYVGTCPGLMLGGVHGGDEAKVYAELCELVKEWIAIHEQDGMSSRKQRWRGIGKALTDGKDATDYIRRLRSEWEKMA
jgi:predicted RNase H-like HicB family nuclease